LARAELLLEAFAVDDVTYDEVGFRV
jgi:hypothetical protein